MSAPGLRLSGSAWSGEVPLFRDIRFEAPGGVWTCVLGPSGVGKSTILRLLAGLETGVRFQGEASAEDGVALAGRVAWMSQSDMLMPWLDVTQNVGFGARLRRRGGDPAAVDALVGRLGLGPHRGKRPSALSGGQRQRVALARTLMEDRPVVLLDEPFSALDARTRAEMQELAFEMLAGRTVVLVTHDAAEAARLGARIWLLTEAGLAAMPVPPGPPIRGLADPETLAAAAAMIARMRGAA